jgi:hypothetical protein
MVPDLFILSAQNLFHGLCSDFTVKTAFQIHCLHDLGRLAKKLSLSVLHSFKM